MEKIKIFKLILFIFLLIPLSSYSTNLTWKKYNINQTSNVSGYSVKSISLTPKTTGANWDGQFGVGNTNSSLIFINMLDISKTVSCSASLGGSHTICIQSDGIVKVVGNNNAGQLGIGNLVSQSTPVIVNDFFGAKQCSAGYEYTICLMSDGKVKATGRNNSGQLGDGTTIDRNVPTYTLNINNAVYVTAGHSHSIIIESDGSVKVFGNNGNGQLGINSMTNISIPAVAPINSPTSCSAGSYHTVCVMSDGTVKGAGINIHGQLGTGAQTQYNSFIDLLNYGINNQECSSGNIHTVCVKKDGNVFVSGNNADGQLGLGDKIDRMTAINNPNLTGAIKCLSGQRNTICFMEDGTVKGSGYGNTGIFGNNNTAEAIYPIILSNINSKSYCSISAYYLVCIDQAICQSPQDSFAFDNDGNFYFCLNNSWKNLEFEQ